MKPRLVRPDTPAMRHDVTRAIQPLGPVIIAVRRKSDSVLLCSNTEHLVLLCERLFFSPKHLKLKIPSNYAAITRAIICGDGIFVMIVVMVIVVAMGIVMIMMFIFFVFQPVEVLCKRWTGWRLSSGDSPCLFVVLDLWMTPCLNWPNRWHWMSQPKTMVRGVHYHRWPQTLSRNGF